MNDTNNEYTKKDSLFLSNKLLKNITRKLLYTTAIYFVFYYQLSFFWILSLIVLKAMNEEKKIENERKHNIKRVAHLIGEKEAVMARLKELPSWVVFPDVDRAEWLNKIIKQLWPHVNKYFIKMLRNSIQAKIKKKFDSFRFELIELGFAPPRIDGVKVYDSFQKNEIIIDFKIFYDGDCDINFSIYGTNGSIRDMQMDVETRVVLKPIITKMPLVGGMQIFFLNNPEIDLVLEGIASIPGLGYYIKKKIVKNLAKKMVFPNKIPIKLSKSVDSVDLKWLEPEGVLRVHVIEAANLERKDINVLGIGKSDPYVVLSVGAQEFKTKVINNTTDPKWDFWCEFSILDPTVQRLDIEVLDHDLKSHDFLGSAIVDILSVAQKGQKDQWITLEKVKHGKIHLRFTWLTLSTNYSDLEAAIEEKRSLEVQEMSTALLTTYIDSATGLPQIKEFRNPDPYVVMTVGNKSLTTKVKRHTSNPAWEQGFSFLISHPESDALYMTIIDKHTGQTLDQLVYEIHNLINKENLEVNKEELKLSKGESDSKLIISLQLRILQSSDEIEIDDDDSTSDGELSRQNSLQSNKSSHSDSIKQFIATESKKDLENVIENKFAPKLSTTIDRNQSFSSSTGRAGLGRLELTLRYSIPRQKLIIVIHRIAHLPLKDPTDIPDPYVKLQLLPQAVGEKYKTRVIMDNCNPVYDEIFEYLISQSELHKQKLILTIKTKTKFSLSNRFIGQVIIQLSELNLTKPFNGWFDLLPLQTSSI